MPLMQDIIVKNLIRAYTRLAELSHLFTFIETDRTQRFESDIPFGLFNSVVAYTRAEEVAPSEEIESIKALYHSRGQKMQWLTYSHQRDEVIDQALELNDLKPAGVIAGLGLSLEGWQSDLPDMLGFEVRVVREPHELEAFRATILAGYNIPETMAEIFCKVFVDGPAQDATIQHYLAYLDGVPVTTLTTFIEGDIAGIYSIATLEAYRSRGLARTMLAHVLGVVQQKRAKFAVIHATPMGRSVYPSVGFKEELEFTIYKG